MDTKREIFRREKIKPNPPFISSKSEIVVLHLKALVLVSTMLFMGR